MEFFKHNTQIDFMAQRKWAAMLSIVLFLFSLGSLAFKGLNWGLDFTGGTQIQLSYPEAADLGAIRASLEAAGFADAVVISFGTSKDVMVTLVPKHKGESATSAKGQADIVNQVVKVLPGAKINEVNYTGPQVGEEMTSKS